MGVILCIVGSVKLSIFLEVRLSKEEKEQRKKHIKTNRSKHDSSFVMSFRTGDFGSNRHAIAYKETLFNIVRAHEIAPPLQTG